MDLVRLANLVCQRGDGLSIDRRLYSIGLSFIEPLNSRYAVLYTKACKVRFLAVRRDAKHVLRN